MTQKKITLRNTKKEIFEAYQKIANVSDIKNIENLMERVNARTGTRNHSIWLNAKNLLRALKKYS